MRTNSAIERKLIGGFSVRVSVWCEGGPKRTLLTMKTLGIRPKRTGISIEVSNSPTNTSTVPVPPCFFAPQGDDRLAMLRNQRFPPIYMEFFAFFESNNMAIGWLADDVGGDYREKKSIRFNQIAALASYPFQWTCEASGLPPAKNFKSQDASHFTTEKTRFPVQEHTC